MRRPGQSGGDGPRGRLVHVEPSTVARAGEAATRLALEDTLLRTGWRVLFFEEDFGPLLGPAGTRLDGIAVRLKPGGGEHLELRLLRVESGTLEIRESSVEQLSRLAGTASLAWLLAAFDGEEMRLVPDLDAPEGRPAQATLKDRLTRAARAALGIEPSLGPPSPSPPAGRPAKAVTGGPPARPPARAEAGRARARGERRRGSRRAPSRVPAAPSPSPQATPGHPGGVVATPEKPKRSRRRGKRGGRRRSGRGRSEAT